MKIKMKKFYLLDFKEDKRKYERFRQDLLDDVLVGNYLSRDLEDYLVTPTSLERIEPNNSYVVSDNGRNLVGYARVSSLSVSNFLELQYAIHGDYRGKGYGVSLLRELTDYAFVEFPNVKGTELYIHQENFRSIHCALASGYQEVESLGNVKHYLKIKGEK